MFDNIPGDLAVGVIQIPKHPHPGHTGRHAGRFFSFFNKLNAETAFLDVTLFFNDPNIVGTGRNAILTADAFIFVNQDDSIFSFMGGPRGTDLHAGRVVAVLALNRQELTPIIWEGSIFPLLKVIVSLLFVEAVLVVTGHSTGMTPHTFRLIDHHSIPSHNSPNFRSHLFDFRFKTPTSQLGTPNFAYAFVTFTTISEAITWPTVGSK